MDSAGDSLGQALVSDRFKHPEVKWGQQVLGSHRTGSLHRSLPKLQESSKGDLAMTSESAGVCKRLSSKGLAQGWYVCGTGASGLASSLLPPECETNVRSSAPGVC